MNARGQRRLQRGAHLLAGVLLLVYVYAPTPSWGQDVMRFVAFPALVATGVAMWQAARLRRWRTNWRTVGSTQHDRTHVRMGDL